MAAFQHLELEDGQQPQKSGLVDRLLQRMSGSAKYSQISTSDWQVNRDSQERWSPEEGASWWSKLTYSYATGLIKLGYTQPLHQEHLWDMARNNEAQPLSEKFQSALKATENIVTAPHVGHTDLLCRCHSSEGMKLPV